MFVTLKTLTVIEVLLVFGIAFYRLALLPRMRSVVDAKAATLLLLTPPVALFCGNVYIFYAYIVAVVAFTSRTRSELCGTYLLLLPTMPMLVMQTGAGDVYLFPFSAPLMMSLGALIGLAITPRASGGPIRAPFDWACLALIFLFTYIDARNVSVTSIIRTIIFNIVWIGGPYLLLSRSITSAEHLERSMLKLGLVAVTGACVAVFETLRRWVLFQSFYDNLRVPLPMLSATLNMRGGLLRSGGPMIDYTAAGIFFGVVLVSLPWLFERFRPGFRWAVIALTAMGLVVTQSRGAWIAAVIGGLYLLAYRGKWAKAALTLGAAVIAQGVAFASVGRGSKLAEMIGAGGASAGTSDYRKQLLWSGIDQLRSHPWLGQSPKILTQQMNDLIQGQGIVDFVNTHLYIGMVAGLPLLVLWLGIWCLPVLRSWRLRQTGSKVTAAEVPGAIVVTVSASLVATSLIDRNLIWLVIALGVTGPCFAFLRAPRMSPDSPRPRRKLVVGMPDPDDLAPIR